MVPARRRGDRTVTADAPTLFADDLESLDPAEVLARLQVDAPGAWEGTLAEMLDIVTAALDRRGIVDARARAAEIVIDLGGAMGGRYLPKGDDVRRAVRDAQIWRDYNGRNVTDLAVRYRLTVVRVYQVLAAQRQITRGQRQGDLFGAGVSRDASA